MLEIYFDGVLLDPINYMELTQKWVMFDKEFKLGMTPNREFRLTIPKSVFNPNTQEVKIRYNNQDYAYLIIDKYDIEENLVIPKVKLTLCDKMVLFNEGYDASPICPTTCKGILEDICNKFGVELGTTTFLNEDESVNFWDSTTTARDYISYISEIAGGFARIENDGKLYIRYFEDVNTHQLNEALCEQILIGQPHEVERVVFDNGVLKFSDTKRSNYCPDIYDASWVFSNGAFIDNGAIKLPNLNSTAKIRIKLNKRSKVMYVGFMVVNGGNAHISIDYLDKDGTRLNGNGNSIKDKPNNYWHSVGFGGNNEYGDAISKAVYIRLVFQRSTGYAPNEYSFKDVVICTDGNPSGYRPYIEENKLETLYLNPSNVYINTEEQFDNLVHKILGFKYWNLTTGNAYILPDAMCGDVLYLPYNGSNYYTIQNIPELKFLGLWNGGYELNLESGKQQETKQKGLNTQIKAIKIKQDRDENTLEIAVQDIETQKNTTNPKLENLINNNTTLIGQTAQDLRLEASNETSRVNGLFGEVDKDMEHLEDRLGDRIDANTALIQLTAQAIMQSVKTTGGNNLLRNSVGLAGLDFWTKSGTVTTKQDTYTEQNTISGSCFVLTGASTLKQSYITQVGMIYSVSFKIRHIFTGTANPVYIRIHRTENDYDEVLVDYDENNNPVSKSNVEYTQFTSFNVYTYVANVTNPWIEIVSTGDDIFEVSDLIVSFGENQSWSGYFDEVYGKEHRLDKYGLKLLDLASGNFSYLTSTGVIFNENGNIVGQLDKNLVKSASGEFTNSYKIRGLNVVALDDDNIVEYRN